MNAKRAVCWLLLTAALLCWRPLSLRLPVSNEGLAAQSYAGWSGVLRVWVSGGWQPGGASFIPWLNRCAARFEKKHPGVYLQMESVGAALLPAFAQAQTPPDAILFPPGMLEGGARLCALEQAPALRPELADAGRWGDRLCALPVAMGGYAWAINRAMLDQAPLDWGALDAPAPLRKQARYLMQAPQDEPYRCWSCALCALCAPRRVTAQGTVDAPAGEGVDLGLPESADASPTPTPETTLVLCGLPAALPENFRTDDDFYTGFVRGAYAAIPVTQREIRRLQILSESGRAPDWAVQSGGAAFTDQLLMMAVPEIPREDAAARQALAREFLSYLLGEDCQRALGDIYALRVTRGEALYAGQRGMAELETSTRGLLRAVNAFDTGYRAQGRAEADRLQSAPR